MGDIHEDHKSMTVRASSRCIVAVLSSTSLNRMFAQHPDIADSIKEHTSGKIATLYNDPHLTANIPSVEVKTVRILLILKN
jgi:CRP-like cAMP-binding protein